MRPKIVKKFGGTSLATPASWKAVLSIVRDHGPWPLLGQERWPSTAIGKVSSLRLLEEPMEYNERGVSEA